MHLVPVRSHEQIESIMLSLQIAWRTEELDRLKRRLAPLEQAFASFERKVAESTSSAVNERNRLRAVCVEIEDLTTRIHARLTADPEALLDSLFEPEEMHRIGQLFNVDLEEELRATTGDRSWEYAGDQRERFAEPHHRRPGNDDPEIRSLYRSLARAYHPDLAQNDPDRQFRMEMMLRVNEAWEARDVSTLRALSRDALSAASTSVLGQQVLWQRQELMRLAAACTAAIDRLAALRSSKTRPLWHDAALTAAAIARHMQQLRTEIVMLETRHIRARDEFQQALAAYISLRHQN